MQSGTLSGLCILPTFSTLLCLFLSVAGKSGLTRSSSLFASLPGGLRYVIPARLAFLLPFCVSCLPAFIPAGRSVLHKELPVSGLPRAVPGAWLVIPCIKNLPGEAERSFLFRSGTYDFDRTLYRLSASVRFFFRSGTRARCVCPYLIFRRSRESCAFFFAFYRVFPGTRSPEYYSACAGSGTMSLSVAFSHFTTRAG